MEITDKSQYLGDGVYIYSDGYHLILETDVKIYLDSQVRHALYEILKEEFEES